MALSTIPAMDTPAVRRRPLRAPAVMCEPHDFQPPCAFSRGMEVVLPGARMVFVSGTASVGPDGETLHHRDFRAQARRAFQNARALLRNAGADWHDVVKMTVFLKDIDTQYGPFNEVRSAYFREIGLGRYPASTCVEARLCRHDLLVEMELIAVVSE